jgi:transposase
MGTQPEPGSMAFKLTLIERAELIRRSSIRQRNMIALRARVILLLEQGHSWTAIMNSVGCSRGFIARWSARFRETRLSGLMTRHRGAAPLVMTPRIEARIVRAAGATTADGQPRWSSRTLGDKLGLSHMTVYRIWKRHGVARSLRAKARSGGLHPGVTT